MDIDELLNIKNKINGKCKIILNDIITNRKNINSLTSAEKDIIVDEFEEIFNTDSEFHKLFFAKFTLNDDNRYKLNVLFYILIIRKINQLQNNLDKNVNLQIIMDYIVDDVNNANTKYNEDMDDYIAKFDKNN